jgi:DNA-binding LacI/PurR family transcriptional regulator
VTLQTVADAVGVSRMTVSNAFSRPDQLSPQLRRRILQTAEELGYAGPDATARSLRRGRAGAMGLLFTEALGYAFADPYAVAFLRGLAEAGEHAGLGLLLVPLPPGRPVEAVVDGFCVFSLPEGHPAVEVAVRRRLPLVLVDEPFDPRHPFVGIDDRAAARRLAEHLLALGHRRFGVVVDRVSHDGEGGPVSAERLAAATYRLARERVGGYRDALQAAGVRWEEVAVLEAPPNNRASGRRAGHQLLAAEPPPTAVLAISDVLALGVVDAATERGVDVPGRLSVAGFDDIPEAASSGLTTIRQPAEEKGRAAARLLLTPPAGPVEPLLLPTELIVRTSTAAAPARTAPTAAPTTPEEPA